MPKFNLAALSTCTALLALSCFTQADPVTDISEATTRYLIKEVSRTNINQVKEPSGLSIAAAPGEYWTVSDQRGLAYRIDAGGKVLDTAQFRGEDLEGIYFDQQSNALFIAEERRRYIINYSLEDHSTKIIHVPDQGGSSNSGFEGVTMGNNRHLFILNEKKPALIIETDLEGKLIDRYEITGGGDISGITYDSTRDCFWILSDEAEQLLVWTPSRGIIAKQPIILSQPEGVAVSEDGTKITLISDSGQEFVNYVINPRFDINK